MLSEGMSPNDILKDILGDMDKYLSIFSQYILL